VDRSKKTILAIYRSLVRAYLEYCVRIWNPYSVKDVKLIESVQIYGLLRLGNSALEVNKYDERLKYRN